MSTTLNSSYLSNPLTVGQGGSGVATNTTAYGLLAAGTSSTNSFQNAGTGTTGQMPVSGGASALPTWTNQNAIGTWQLLSTQTASNSASIAFTGLTTSYSAYKILISNYVPVTTVTRFQLQFSTDNGSSWLTGTNYNWCKKVIRPGGTNTVLNNNSVAILLDYQSFTKTANKSSAYEITFINPDISIANPGVHWISGNWDNGGGVPALVAIIGQGYYSATQATNAIRFISSSGNLSSGTFNLYGILT
jgi:hypothetical protein